MRKGKEWTDKEDLVAVYLYRSRKHRLRECVLFFARQIGRGHDGSLKMRIGNVEAVATGKVEGNPDGKGLDSVTIRTKKVWNKYKDKSLAEIESELQKEGIKLDY